ncbi:MAG: hypothetical protein ABJB86_23490 [Bacteroidota bacterium]
MRTDTVYGRALFGQAAIKDSIFNKKEEIEMGFSIYASASQPSIASFSFTIAENNTTGI